MESKDSSTEKKRRRSDQDRIESWKAIANYLNRSVRTARRWEAREGLPVHRQQFAKGNAVFAYRNELDEWRNAHHQPRASERKEERVLAGARLPPMLLGLLVGVLVAGLLGGILGKSLLPEESEPRAANLTSDAWILIAEPVNHPALREFGAKFKATLHREFGGSREYPVLPAARIRKTLELMRKKLNSGLDPEIARELAQRDGRVKVLLIPRIENLGGSHLIGLEAILPHNGFLIAYLSDETKTLQSASPVFTRLARDLHSKLAKMSIELKAEILESVTTSSLSALRLYTEAYRLLVVDRPNMAQIYLGQAVEQDESFVAARALLAWALRMDGADREAYLPLITSAMDDDRAITVAEQFLIEGSYHHFLGNSGLADANYKTLLENQPGHAFAARARLMLCLESDPADGCAEQKAYLADLSTTDFEINVQAAWALAQDPARSSDAERYANRSLDILQADYTRFDTDSTARALFFPVISAWTNGDMEAALGESRQLRHDLAQLPFATRRNLTRLLVEFYLVLGRIDEADHLLTLVSDPSLRYELKAKILFASNEMDQLRKHLASGKHTRARIIALLMSIAGLDDQAGMPNQESDSDPAGPARQAVIRAGLALGNKDLDSAKLQLQGEMQVLIPQDFAFYFVAADLLATIHEMEGNSIEAVSILEKTMPRKNEAIFNNAGLFWLKCQENLVRLYRAVGRTHEANLVEQDLRKMFGVEDSDITLERI